MTTLSRSRTRHRQPVRTHLDQVGPVAGRRRSRLDREAGSITIWFLVLAIPIGMFLGLLIDGGRILTAQIRAIDEAEEAARAGAQAIDLTALRETGTLRVNPAQADALVQHYLHGAGHTGTVTVTGSTVTVIVTITQTTPGLAVIGRPTTTTTGTGHAQPHRGVSTDNS